MDEPPPSLRQVWTEIVSADDYDAHMAAVGQAQANAEIVRTLLDVSPPQGPRLLIAGAGTGQMFDFVDANFLEPFTVTFTDINPAFLRRLDERLARTSWRSYTTVVDDLERTRLEPPFDGALLVLVLEHIDWRKGVRSLGCLRPGLVFIVTQENPPDMPTAVAPSRPLIGSMNVFRHVHPNLVPPDQLIEAMAAQRYTLMTSDVRQVLDKKKMVGMVFARNG